MHRCVGPTQGARFTLVISVDPTEAGNNRCSATTCAVQQVGPSAGRSFGLNALAD